MQLNPVTKMSPPPQWVTNVTGYAMADPFICFKQFFRISKNGDILEFSLPKDGDNLVGYA